MSCPLPEKSDSPKRGFDKAGTSDYTVYSYISTVRGSNLEIAVSNSSSLPIYEQIKEQIKEQILSGELSENGMLPSLRQLAKVSLYCRAAPIL